MAINAIKFLNDSRKKKGTNYHIKASVLTLMVAAIWSPLSSMIKEPVVLRYLLTFLYLLECVLSSTRRYLSNSLSPHQLTEYVRRLQGAEPTIIWEVQCYHYSRVFTRNDRRTSTSREKVFTHRARQIMPVSKWKDVTSTSTLERAIADENNNRMSNSSPTTFLKTTLSKLFVFNKSAFA